MLQINRNRVVNMNKNERKLERHIQIRIVGSFARLEPKNQALTCSLLQILHGQVQMPSSLVPPHFRGNFVLKASQPFVEIFFD